MEGIILIAILISAVTVVLVYRNKKYKRTAYYQITKNSYSSIKYDKGRHGEYSIYKNLRHLENSGGKFLFNLFIPKGNNETAEIDLLLICPKGLFVFESKNYGGWIFGNEADTNWTQTFPLGRGVSRKEHFYNPIRQNASHIKHLKRLIGANVSVLSVIVFSDRCTLKDVTIKSSDVSVVKRKHVASAVAKICRQTEADHLTVTEINDIYNKLYPYTQVSNETRTEHAWNIQKYLSDKPY